jgi:hypothetical protein
MADFTVYGRLVRVAPPQMWFVSLRSGICLQASFPPRLAATQLPLASVGITSSTQDFHLRATAHAGRTAKVPPVSRGHLELLWVAA